VINPADPPVLMRDTIYCALPGGTDATVEARITESVQAMAKDVSGYVPGYRLLSEPQFDTESDGTRRVAILIEVEGAGDYLPPYAGNLDIMTAAATRVGESIASARVANGETA